MHQVIDDIQGDGTPVIDVHTFKEHVLDNIIRSTCNIARLKGAIFGRETLTKVKESICIIVYT